MALRLTAFEHTVLADLMGRFQGVAFDVAKAYPGLDAGYAPKRKAVKRLAHKGALIYSREGGSFRIDYEAVKGVAI